MDSLPTNYQDVCTIVGQLYLESRNKILSLEQKVLDLTLAIQELRNQNETAQSAIRTKNN